MAAQSTLFAATRRRAAPAIPRPQTQSRGLHTSSAGTLRQQLNIAGQTSTAGAALDHLKKTADRFVEEQESAKQNIEAFTRKLEESQQMQSKLEANLVKERQDNAQLRARIKDDQTQVQLVLEKMGVVQALHDGLKAEVDDLGLECKKVDDLHSDLSRKIGERTNFCADFAERCANQSNKNDVIKKNIEQVKAAMKDVQREKKSLQEELNVSKSDCLRLEQMMNEVKALGQEQIAELHKQIQDANMTIQQTSEQKCALEQTFLDKKAKMNQKCTSMQGELAELKQQNSNIAAELKHAFKKHEDDEAKLCVMEQRIQAAAAYQKEAEIKIKAMQEEIEAKATDLEAALEQVKMCETRIQDVLLKTKEQEENLAAVHEHKNSMAHALQECKAEKEQLQQCVIKHLEELGSAKVKIEELNAESAETEIASKNRYLELEKELDDVKRKAEETGALLQQKLIEAQDSAEQKVQRFAERTARELEDIQARDKAESDSTIRKFEEQIAGLHVEKLEMQKRIDECTHEIASVRASHSTDAKKHQEEVEKLKAGFIESMEEGKRVAKEAQETHERELHARSEANSLAIAEIEKIHKKEIQDLQKQVSTAEEQIQQIKDKHAEEKENLGRRAKLDRENMLLEMDQRVGEAMEQSEMHQSQLQETQNLLEKAKTQIIEMEAKLKVAHVEAEKQALLFNQVNGRMREVGQRGPGPLGLRKGDHKMAKPDQFRSPLRPRPDVQEPNLQRPSPTLEKPRAETEPAPRLRRDVKRKRCEVLQHTVARPSRSRMSSLTGDTLNTQDTFKREKRYRKGNAGVQRVAGGEESAAKSIFGDACMFDPYTFEN